MDLLASYDDENTGENSVNLSPKPAEDKTKSNSAPNMLENEWLSFEQMIAPGGPVGNTEPVKSSEFLVNGVVAYPGMKSNAGLALEEQSSASSEDESELAKEQSEGVVKDDAVIDDDDDAFFKLRKQVKERDGSSSSDSSRSSSPGSRSPSPPHLSPVNSVKSHTSEPPQLTDATDGKQLTENKTEEKTITPDSKGKDRHRSKSRDRKRSHRDSSRREHGSSKSKRRRSRSHSKDRKRRSKDRHRRKDKKSRDRKSRKDSRRSKSRDRKDSKSESKKSESHNSKDGKSETIDNENSERKLSESGENKNSKSDSHRKRSRSSDRKDRKKSRRSRSRSRHRHRSHSKDRKSKERKRSHSKERKRSRSRDRKRKPRSRSRERRSRSRDRNHRERFSRSRSRERLRSRSPVLGRKLTFKEQMRKQFINASKEMNQENKGSELESLRKPGEGLRPSDLLKGVKLTGGDSVTPQMALMQTMAAMHKKAQELTGVEVPKYYNPAAVNPLKYAEQVQKRKLLWSKKTEEKDKNDQIETQWKSALLGGNEDGKSVSKFRKLMGMKGEDGQSSAEEMPEDMQKMSEEQRRKQAELFQRLDQEYQFARMTTHTQRGVGLGFSTTVIDPNHPQNPT